MISLAEINLAAEKFHVSAEVIEKDYVITWILCCLTRSRLKNDFIFYGGTAIKRIYFENYRFSEDIDLWSASTYTQEYIIQELKILNYAKEEAGLSLELQLEKSIVASHRLQLFISYDGYEEIIGAPKEIRMDFVIGMDKFGNFINKKIIPSYSDVKTQENTLSVMTLNTILANKLGLIVDSTRNEPRDLFDIWYLLWRTKKFNFSFQKVCDVFKDKYGFQPTLNILLAHLKNRSLEKSWNIRLKKQMAKLPPIEIVIKDVEMMLKKLFKDRL